MGYPNSIIQLFLSVADLVVQVKYLTIEIEEEETGWEEANELPNSFLSLAPIVVPILLIASASVVKFLKMDILWLAFLGHPLVALHLGSHL